MPPPSINPTSDLNRFVARYTPNIAKLARGALARMRKRLPTAHQFVRATADEAGAGCSQSAPQPYWQGQGDHQVDFSQTTSTPSEV